MKCIYCATPDTKVIDSREINNMSVIRRRRHCTSCGRRFTTYERVEHQNLMAIKKDGRRESFNRDKIKKGIIRACEKRPISMHRIEEIISEIELYVRQNYSTEIPASVIGEFTMNKLKSIDPVAYIRFASVYRSFSDLLSFEKELKHLKCEINKNNSEKGGI